MMIVTSVVGAAVGAFGIYWTTTSQIEPLEYDLRRVALAEQAHQLAADEAVVEADVRVLQGHPASRALLLAAANGDDGEASRQELDAVFMALLAAKREYLQARLIGAAPAGKELVRWEQPPSGVGPPVAIASSELQAKGHRDYVRAALALPEGEMDVSPIELNEERGRVAEPHVPVLRVAMPIYGGGRSQALGMVVINVDMRSTLQKLSPIHAESRLYAVRVPDGSYLASPDPASNFGAELGLPSRFQDEHPSLAWVVDDPHAWSGRVDEGDGEALVTVAPVDARSRHRAVLIEVAPPSAAKALQRGRLTTLVVGVAMALFSTLIAFFLGRSIVRPLTQMAHEVRGYEPDQPVQLALGVSQEMDALARAFHTMQGTVRERTKLLDGQREAFRRLVDDAPVAMLVLDQEQHIQLANRVATELFGDRDKLIGTSVLSIVPQFEDVSVGHEDDDEPSAPLTLEGRRHDGAVLLLGVSISVSAPDADNQRRVVVSLVDVTLRERAAQELMRSNEALAEFAYLASHDLQEPLRMVAGYADLLQHHYATAVDERGAKFLSYIGDGARRMRGLITALLGYSRVAAERAELVPVAVDKVVADVLATLAEPIAESGATIDVGELPAVMGEMTLLRQVFQNLIGNALKFRREVPPEITIRAKRDGANVRFAVGDNGIGIGEEAVDRVFQMFQRLHPVGGFEGSGIGLAFAKRIVHQHGGEIWCESTLGKGTTFYFTARAAATR